MALAAKAIGARKSSVATSEAGGACHWPAPYDRRVEVAANRQLTSKKLANQRETLSFDIPLFIRPGSHFIFPAQSSRDLLSLILLMPAFLAVARKSLNILARSSPSTR